MLNLSKTEPPPRYAQHYTKTLSPVQVEPLAEADREAALDFLSERPIETVIMAGWIMERGIESPRHRGTFYGCWNAHGILEGVALIGWATLFETRSDAALHAFADLAKRDASIHLLFAEATELEKFWLRYKQPDQTARMHCHELLYEKEAEHLRTPKAVAGLRKARSEEAGQVASAHALLVTEEIGENPLDKDPAAFQERCAARIEQGKVWILMEEGELIFKADVVAETPDAVYVEGLWVNPLHRRQGYGQLCWNALCQALVIEKSSLCGFVNDENVAAKAFYAKVGCRLRARFDKIFV